MTESVKNSIIIDAAGVYYRELNQQLREAVAGGATRIELRNVQGQRYIGTDLGKPVEIEIYGTPGNDCASASWQRWARAASEAGASRRFS